MSSFKSKLSTPQVEDLIKLDSWEKYIIEEADLEDMYRISSIRSTIQKFEGIVQDLIAEAAAESVVLETEAAERHAAGEGPSGVDKDAEEAADDIRASTTDDQLMRDPLTSPMKSPPLKHRLLT